MPVSSDTLDWRMTFAFAAGMAVVVLVTKLVSTLQLHPPARFWLTLLASPHSLRRARPAARPDKVRSFQRLIVATLGFAAYWFLCVALVKSTEATGLWIGWLAAPLVWLMGEACGSLHQVLLLPTGKLIPLPHDHIFAARSVADFWGRRWNVWMSDWFRQTLFLPWRRQPVAATLAVFLLSGVMHELVLNLTLWLVTGTSLFGTMMAYFGLQAAGVFIERNTLAAHPRLKRLFAWLIVVGPAPLFVNEGILRAFHLWP